MIILTSLSFSDHYPVLETNTCSDIFRGSFNAISAEVGIFWTEIILLLSVTRSGMLLTFEAL
jgi:hypothetical protein